MRLHSTPLVLIGAGYGMGAVAFARLPDYIPPTFMTAPWMGRAMAAFLLPTAAAVTYGLLRSLYTGHPLERGDSMAGVAANDAILVRVVLFLTAVHGTILLGLTGALWGRAWAARIIPVLLGCALIGIGNLLPRTRPNLAIGIRTADTLDNPAVWTRTHRVAGYLVVLLGLVILLSAVAVPSPLGPLLSRLVEPAALFGVPGLVLYSRRMAARDAGHR
ncbi:MAG TPA: SdpI family protein [Vicinamibacterales bacterium]|jgi:uncharacterized membrane protein